MANTIKIKRGLSSNIDNTTLAQGELAITTDTNELYVGKEGGKEKINVQANYNQNDEKAADYIKNRPFYEISNTIFQGNVTFTKREKFDYYSGRSIEVYSGTVPFSTSFKKDDFKKVWRLQISYEEKQEKLRRYSWNYENGQDNNFKYVSYFITTQGYAGIDGSVCITSSDTALEIDIPADGETVSTKTMNITITTQMKSDVLDLMSLEDIEEINSVLQGEPPR